MPGRTTASTPPGARSTRSSPTWPRWSRSGERDMAAAEALVTAMPVEEVRVDLGPRSYPVVIGADVLALLGPKLVELGHRGRCAVVTSPRVGDLYGDAVVRSLRLAGLEATTIRISDGEESKNLDILGVVYDGLLQAGIDRRAHVVALGGGVIGDVAGFAAATVLRGIPVVQVPTTLLAQVDAAIGGKTGIDHARGKNLIGAFHQPRLVLADVDTLATLPRREFVAGMAEVVKYGALGDRTLFEEIEGGLPALVALDRGALVAVVTACARQKARVVSADEREETGLRAVLNFGHTIGHAVETVTGYRRFLHGEAVAIGMVAAARISHRLGCGDAAAVERLEGLLGRIGLPVALPGGIDPQAVGRVMAADKKAASGRIRFIALEEIGRTRVVELTPADIVGHLVR